MLKVIWQRAASPTCHHSRLRMDSSDADPINYMVPWTHLSKPPKRHLHHFSRADERDQQTDTYYADSHADRQTTLLRLLR